MAVVTNRVARDRKRMVICIAAVGLHVAVRALIGEIEFAGDGIIGGRRQARMRPRIKSGGTAGQFTNRAEQKIILHRMMRRPRGVRPRRTAIVVALGAQVDVCVRIIFIGERRYSGRVRAGQTKSIGRRSWITQLIRKRICLMRIMADGASYRDVVIFRKRDRRIFSTNHRKARGTGMAHAASPNVVGAGTHGLQNIRHHGGVAAGRPFFIRRRIAVSRVACTVASAADCRGNIHAWHDGKIIRIGGVIRSRAVTIFALHSSQLRRRGRAYKTSGQSVTDRVTWQTGRIILSARIFEFWIAEGERVRRVGFVATNIVVTLDASLGTDVTRRRPGHTEKSGAV